MAALRDVLVYLIKHYPHKSELSKARLTKMVYLADWKSALDRGVQLTGIVWKFNHFGPYVDDVYNLASKNAEFKVIAEVNMFGNQKDRIDLSDPNVPTDLTREEADVLNHVIEQTRSLSWDPFIKLVYSTFPVLTGTRGGELDLVSSAATYREVEPLLH